MEDYASWTLLNYHKPTTKPIFSYRDYFLEPLEYLLFDTIINTWAKIDGVILQIPISSEEIEIKTVPSRIE
jgi:hypothetical protein